MTKPLNFHQGKNHLIIIHPLINQQGNQNDASFPFHQGNPNAKEWLWKTKKNS